MGIADDDESDGRFNRIQEEIRRNTFDEPPEDGVLARESGDLDGGAGSTFGVVRSASMKN